MVSQKKSQVINAQKTYRTRIKHTCCKYFMLCSNLYSVYQCTHNVCCIQDTRLVITFTSVSVLMSALDRSFKPSFGQCHSWSGVQHHGKCRSKLKMGLHRLHICNATILMQYYVCPTDKSPVFNIESYFSPCRKMEAKWIVLLAPLSYLIFWSSMWSPMEQMALCCKQNSSV